MGQARTRRQTPAPTGYKMLKFMALIAITLPGMAQAQVLWEDAGTRVQTVAYTCDSGLEDMAVAYFTAPDSTSFAALQLGGTVHAMVQTVSGSGVRYSDIDEQSGYRLHTKGDLLLLLKQAADDSAEEQLLASCTAQG